MSQKFPDQIIVLLYREFSNTIYSAGFISPTTAIVHRFREWIEECQRTKLESYEEKMLDEYHRQMEVRRET